MTKGQLREDRFIETLIGQIYEIVGDSIGSKSLEPLLEAFCNSFDGALSALVRYDIARDEETIISVVESGSLSSGSSPDIHSLFNGWSDDRASALQPGCVWTNNHAIGIREFHNSMGNASSAQGRLPYWLRTICGVVHRVDDRIWYVGVAAPDTVPPFDEPATEAFRRLALHFDRAFRLKRTGLEHAVTNKALEASFDRLSLGVAIVCERGIVKKMNTAATQILQSGSGLRLNAGQIEATDGADNKRLRALINGVTKEKAATDAALEDGGALLLSQSSVSRSISLFVSPLPSTDALAEPDSRAAAIFISNPDRLTRNDVKSLGNLYGLTPTEARMATHIAAGLSIEMSAEEMGVTRETARTHLKRIFGKTGTNRQGELVALLLNSPTSARLS